MTPEEIERQLWVLKEMRNGANNRRAHHDAQSVQLTEQIEGYNEAIALLEAQL